MHRLFLSATALALAALPALAQNTVRIGTEGAYPPYNFLNDAGEVAGFERELGDELCARAELDCQWVTNEWDSIIPNLVSGNHDAIMAGMSINDQRDEVIDLTQPYTQPDPSAYVALIEDVDLGGAVIAAQTGTLQAGHVAASDNATLVEFATFEETVAAVRNGEADAALADKAFLEPIVEASGDVVFVGDGILLGEGMGIGLRESDDNLQDAVDAAIQSMKDDGSLNELIEKWLPGSATF